LAISSRHRTERRAEGARIAELGALSTPLVALAKARLAAPLLYLELTGLDSVPVRSRRATREACLRAVASALRSAAGSVLRKNDVVAAGPGAQWFVALLVDRAVSAPAKREIDESEVGAIAQRLRVLSAGALQALHRSGDLSAKIGVRCGWTVLDPVDVQRPLADLRQAVRGASVVARLEAQRATVLAAVTHELRTPLTSIVGYVERLGGSKVTVEQRDRFCAIIASEARRLHRLVDGLIDLGAWTAGKISLRRERVSLRELVAGAWEAVAPIAAPRGVSMTLSGEADAEADPERMLQVLINVLENAARHAPPSSVVTAQVSAPGGRRVVIIADKGGGFEPRVRRTFGLPYVRGTNGRTGLGLAISRLLVEAHGGKMKVGGGTKGGRVTIELP